MWRMHAPERVPSSLLWGPGACSLLEPEPVHGRYYRALGRVTEAAALLRQCQSRDAPSGETAADAGAYVGLGPQAGLAMFVFTMVP